MKKKLSISLEESTIEKLDLAAQGQLFRNKSHIVEIALDKFLREIKYAE